MDDNGKNIEEQKSALPLGIYEMDSETNTMGPIKIKKDTALESSGSNYSLK